MKTKIKHYIKTLVILFICLMSLFRINTSFGLDSGNQILPNGGAGWGTITPDGKYFIYQNLYDNYLLYKKGINESGRGTKFIHTTSRGLVTPDSKYFIYANMLDGRKGYIKGINEDGLGKLFTDGTRGGGGITTPDSQVALYINTKDGNKWYKKGINESGNGVKFVDSSNLQMIISSNGEFVIYQNNIDSNRWYKKGINESGNGEIFVNSTNGQGLITPDNQYFIYQNSNDNGYWYKKGIDETGNGIKFAESNGGQAIIAGDNEFFLYQNSNDNGKWYKKSLFIDGNGQLFSNSNSPYGLITPNKKYFIYINSNDSGRWYKKYVYENGDGQLFVDSGYIHNPYYPTSIITQDSRYFVYKNTNDPINWYIKFIELFNFSLLNSYFPTSDVGGVATLSFSKPLDLDSMQRDIKLYANGTEVPMYIYQTGDNKLIVLRPSSRAFNYNTEYTLKISSNLKSTDGDYFGTEQSFKFSINQNNTIPVGFEVNVPAQEPVIIGIDTVEFNTTQALASAPDKATIGDPVSLDSGDFTYSNILISNPGIGLPLNLEINNKAQTYYNGSVGINWDHSYNIFLKEDYDGNILYSKGKFGIYTFIKNKDGSFEEQESLKAKLQKVTIQDENYYEMTFENGSRQIFGSNLKIKYLSDNNDNKLQFTYDTNNKLTQIIDTLGKVVNFTYNDTGRIVEITDSYSNKVNLEYFQENDSNGSLFDLKNIIISKTTNPESAKTISFTYSKVENNPVLSHNILTLTDSKSQVYVQNTYDDKDRVSSQKYGDGTINYEYTDLTGTGTTEIKKTKATDRNGNVVNYTFDKNGNVLEKEIASTITKYTYTSSGKLFTETLPKGNGTKYSYDDKGNVTEVRKKGNMSIEDNDNLDIIAKTTYENTFNKVSEIIYPNGVKVNFTYDNKGNTTKVTKTTSSNTEETNLEYNDKGQLIKQIDNLGIVTTFEYIGSNLVTKVVTGTQGTILTTKYEYDTNNNLIKVIDPNGNENTFEYSDFNQIKKSITPEGIEKEFIYDLNNNLLSQSTKLDNNKVVKNTYNYNLLDKPVESKIQIDDTNYKTIKLSYDPNENIKESTDAFGNSITYKYNSFGKISEKTQKINSTNQTLTTQFTYDTNGNLTKTTNPKGIETTYEYDNFDRLIKVIDSNGTYSTFEYDKVGNVINAKIYSKENIILSNKTNTFDLNGNLIKTCADRSQSIPTNQSICTTYAYNNQNQLTQTTDPKSNKTTYTYDEFGRNKEVIDSKGNKQVFTYDKLGNIIEKSIIQNNGKTNTTKYSYDKDNRLITSSVIASGSEANHNTFKYNNLNQIIEKKDGNGNITNYEYDYVGNITKKIEYLKDTATNNLKQVITQYSYDLNGNITKITDPNNNETKYSYDELNRLIKTIYSDNSELVYTYDELNNLITQKDPNGTITTNTYDNLNRLIERNITLGTGVEGVTKETYEYDDLGRLTRSTDNLGTILKFSYDEFGRLTSEDQNGKIVNYDYDLNGNIINSVYPSGKKVSRSYDELNRLTGIQDIINNSTSTNIATYTYNGLEEKELMYGNNTKTNYTYDEFGRLSNLTNSTNKEVYNWKTRKFDLKPEIINNYSYTYDGINNITSNGKDNYTYDELDRITDVKYSTNIDKIKSLEKFQYDNTGNRVSSSRGMQITNKNDLSKIDNFKLDDEEDDIENSLFNLKEKEIESKLQDKLSNLKKTSYTSNNLNQYTNIENGGLKIEKNGNPQKSSDKIFGQSFTYDKNGNLKDDSKQRYYYDYRNRLVRIEKITKYKFGKFEKEKTENIASFKYDVLGRRIEKRITENYSENFGEGKIIKYIYSNQDIIEESTFQVDRKGKEKLESTKEYVYGNKGIDDLIQLRITNDKGKISNIYYYHKNHLGSITSISDNKGKVIESYDYDVFGKAYKEINVFGRRVFSNRFDSQIDNTRLYTGRELDKEIGLYYYRTRYYSADLGRFISRDPIGQVDDINLYGYVGNSPVGRVDPMGLAECSASKTLIVGFKGYPGPSVIQDPNDPESGIFQILNKFSGKQNIETKIFGASLLGYNDDKEAFNYIKDNNFGKIIILGHSYGADTAVGLASKLKDQNIKVDLLVTMDICGGYGCIMSDWEVSNNVKKTVNYYQTNDFTSEDLPLYRVPFTDTVLISNYIEKRLHGENINMNITNILKPNSEHTSIDNDVVDEAYLVINGTIGKKK